MSFDFVVEGLNYQEFADWFALPEEKLAELHACVIVADSKPGYPCRVSLEEAEEGERILLISYPYHQTESAYRASGPIFVRENAKGKKRWVNELPEVMTTRLMSLRAYSESGQMVTAGHAQGTSKILSLIQDQLSNRDVSYIQVHNANPGCYSCLIKRA